ncbi:PhzF family phenazine biosynthesis isomerase [Proteus sp. G2669]|uniref:PhzF family phenazine biosynthesis protein n=1 Tax=Proteus sp. G2669 TaxID=2698881 RepID=UPI0014128D9F|nr:PhzF family phenazine biosynthesis protein [Proteus sp. G2669]NBM56540.1 PhzF family phenazine biosynthesis isomerase [Proteus sp. G2669]
MQNSTILPIEHEIKVYLVNAFTRNNSGGNPAGVVLNPPNLSDTQKIEIARLVGFSETAFVYTAKETDFKVDFFTPEGEVDFCGHATLATFYTLASLNLIESGSYTQKTKAGILSVAVNSQSIVMEQTRPVMRQGPNIDVVATALGVDHDVIEKTGLPITIISTGLHDIIVPVQPGSLDTLQPNFDAIANLSREFNTIGFHVFELSQDTAITAHCRNFAPLYGINEESATGSSSGALGCYLVNYVFPNETYFLLEQGRAMGCSSLLEVTINSHAQEILRVSVGGQAAIFGEKTIHI